MTDRPPPTSRPELPLALLLRRLQEGAEGCLEGAGTRVYVARGLLAAVEGPGDELDNLLQFLHAGELRWLPGERPLIESPPLGEQDVRRLVAELDALEPCLLGEFRLLPGDVPPEGAEERLLRDLAVLHQDVPTLLDASPWGRVETARRLVALVERGVLRREEALHDDFLSEPGITEESSLHREPTREGAAIRSPVVEDRGAGRRGEFTVPRHLLDYVDLGSPEAEHPPGEPPAPGDAEDEPIAAPDRDALSDDEPAPVTLSFAPPPLERGEALRKLEVVQHVLREVASTLDAELGPGHGRATVQVLLEGAPGNLAFLFAGVVARRDGSFDGERLLENLWKRPEPERRDLLGRSLQDLVERSLSLVSDRVDDEALDAMLERIAGFQEQLRR